MLNAALSTSYSSPCDCTLDSLPIGGLESSTTASLIMRSISRCIESLKPSPFSGMNLRSGSFDSPLRLLWPSAFGASLPNTPMTISSPSMRKSSESSIEPVSSRLGSGVPPCSILRFSYLSVRSANDCPVTGLSPSPTDSRICSTRNSPISAFVSSLILVGVSRSIVALVSLLVVLLLTVFTLLTSYHYGCSLHLLL